MRILERYAPVFFAMLRIVAGFMFACHGAQKLFGALGGERMTEGLMMVAGVIELVGGILIMIGLLTRIAAFISSGEMAFAYFMVHAPNSFWPIINHGELAALYCFLFLYISGMGPGPWSVDAAIRRGRGAERAPVTA